LRPLGNNRSGRLPTMHVVILPTAREAAVMGADAMSDLLAAKPNAVLGLATGSSPLELYRELGRRVRSGYLSLSEATAYLLDEYVGLPQDHEQCYRNVIRREFVALVDIDDRRVHAPDTAQPDLDQAAFDYEASIARSGGIDLQVLGLGTDGHIAFNEPSSSLASRTRVKTLSQQTRADNARFFESHIDQVPRQCITQGVGTIMDARHLLVTAFGETKADAVRHMIEGPVMALWPASALQLHRRVTVLLDPEASAGLSRREYYQDAHALGG
jgi:glucosamine-6-phosphate deaminase